MKHPSDQSESRHLIVTLSFPDGEIVRLEVSDKTGRRYDLLDGEFAASRCNCDEEDPFPVLDNAYIAGFYDDFEFDDRQSGFEDDQEPVAARTAMSHRLNHRKIRALILSQLLKQQKARCH